jgi:hypothetical protein
VGSTEGSGERELARLIAREQTITVRASPKTAIKPESSSVSIKMLVSKLKISTLTIGHGEASSGIMSLMMSFQSC